MPVDDPVDLVRVVAVDHRGHAAHQPGAVVGHAVVRAVAADAGRVDRRAKRLAARPGGDAAAQQALLQQAESLVGNDLPGAVELLDLLLVPLPLALVADGRVAPITEPFGGSLPSRIATIAVQMFSASGGQPGR